MYQVQIIFHSSIFHFLSIPLRPSQQREEALSLVDELSSWSLTIEFQIDDSALSVCWGLWFLWESRLTVSQMPGESHTHTEYSVVHSRDLSIVLTPVSLESSVQDRQKLPLPPLILLSLTMSWYLYIYILCAATPSATGLGPVCITVTVTCQLENKSLFKILHLFHAQENLRRDQSRGTNSRGGLSGGRVGCRFLLQ